MRPTALQMVIVTAVPQSAAVHDERPPCRVYAKEDVREHQHRLLSCEHDPLGWEGICDGGADTIDAINGR